MELLHDLWYQSAMWMSINKHKKHLLLIHCLLANANFLMPLKGPSPSSFICMCTLLSLHLHFLPSSVACTLLSWGSLLLASKHWLLVDCFSKYGNFLMECYMEMCYKSTGYAFWIHPSHSLLGENTLVFNFLFIYHNIRLHQRNSYNKRQMFQVVEGIAQPLIHRNLSDLP